MLSICFMANCPAPRKGLCLLLADARSQFVQAGVRYQGDMSGRTGGFSCAHALKVDHRDSAARLLEEISGRDTGYASSDHEDVDFDIAAEWRELGDGGSVAPKRLSFHAASNRHVACLSSSVGSLSTSRVANGSKSSDLVDGTK